MNKILVTRQEYDEAKAKVEQLIAEATEKGLLEPDTDNEYTREIVRLSKQMAAYEDTFMDLKPLILHGHIFAHFMRYKQKNCVSLRQN